MVWVCGGSAASITGKSEGTHESWRRSGTVWWRTISLIWSLAGMKVLSYTSLVAINVQWRSAECISTAHLSSSGV